MVKPDYKSEIIIVGTFKEIYQLYTEELLKYIELTKEVDCLAIIKIADIFDMQIKEGEEVKDYSNQEEDNKKKKYKLVLGYQCEWLNQITQWQEKIIKFCGQEKNIQDLYTLGVFFRNDNTDKMNILDGNCCFIGGSLEEGDNKNPLDAAVRELTEEANLIPQNIEQVEKLTTDLHIKRQYIYNEQIRVQYNVLNFYLVKAENVEQYRDDYENWSKKVQEKIQKEKDEKKKQKEKRKSKQQLLFKNDNIQKFMKTGVSIHLNKQNLTTDN